MIENYSNILAEVGDNPNPYILSAMAVFAAVTAIQAIYSKAKKNSESDNQNQITKQGQLERDLI
tara:strand:- start:5709 stop:5900 length:192 start_codon:yes stop_codon:yes gene_type:complete